MKRSLLNKWIDALESGRYRKGHGTLKRRDGTCCCLGVLLEELGVPCHAQGSILSHMFIYGGTHSSNTMPTAFYQEHHFYDDVGSIMGGSTSLAKLNDENQTWREVLYYLRNHPERFFTMIEED